MYAGEGERHWIDVVNREIELERLPAAMDGLRLVQVSDIHLDEFTEPQFLREVVRKVNALKPDAVMLTGDFVSYGPRSVSFAQGAAWECAGILGGIQCPRRYGILGNHDVVVGASQVTAAMTAHGIEMLNNRALPWESAGGKIWIAGISDPAFLPQRTDLAIPAAIRKEPEQPVILLCHSPDFVDGLLQRPEGRAVDLMLSGHTHGGQVVLPFVGPLTLPYMGKKYVRGLFRFGKMQLYVNRGIGSVGLPFRFNCPPEITVLTLRRSHGAYQAGLRRPDWRGQPAAKAR